MEFKDGMKALWKMRCEAGGMIGAPLEINGEKTSWKLDIIASPENVDEAIKGMELVAEMCMYKYGDADA